MWGAVRWTFALILILVLPAPALAVASRAGVVLPEARIVDRSSPLDGSERPY